MANERWKARAAEKNKSLNAQAPLNILIVASGVFVSQKPGLLLTLVGRKRMSRYAK